MRNQFQKETSTPFTLRPPDDLVKLNFHNALMPDESISICYILCWDEVEKCSVCSGKELKSFCLRRRTNFTPTTTRE